MDNPWDILPPEDPVERVRVFARDLAWGAVRGQWGVRIETYLTSDPRETRFNASLLQECITNKWGDSYPKLSLLRSFGYLTYEGNNNYILTQKAFELLERPAGPQTVFISYKREESSAFALLVLCRLKSEGLDPFLDLSIPPGDEWHAHLKDKIQANEYFVCLLGPTTLESEWVQKEITWALDAGKRIIPIWHNGFEYKPGSYPNLEAAVNQKQAIIVEPENAEQYNNAVNRLLNALGYTPL